MIDEVIAGDFVDHLAPPGLPAGRAGVKLMFTALRAAFPDLTVTVEDQIAEGDKVVTRQTYRGTHHGPWMHRPPTHRTIEWGVIDILRLRDGQIVEHWAQIDLSGLLAQIDAPDLRTTPAS